MRKYFLVLFVLISVQQFAQPLRTRFEMSNGLQTPTYHEIIDWWARLGKKSKKIKMRAMGMTDAGFPLHLIIVSENGEFDPAKLRMQGKRIILINNGIHPGEPDGIDASMLLVRDIIENKSSLPANVVLAIIPVYNIGGCLNRSANYRVDQDGPEEFGFRGNSQNLDLNRDFIKCDSKDALAFTEIFHLTDPDVFVDNHVSNGADYQHVMTLLTTQHSKLGGVMGEFLHDRFEPALYASMKSKGYPLIPYVNHFGDTPENGWPEFWDSPRYGSGYGALWHTFSFVPETHMLKPYTERVKATYALMQSFIEFTSANAAEIKRLRDQTKKQVSAAEKFPVAWLLDRTQSRKVEYHGYSSGRKPSAVSGLPRLYYDRSQPYTKEVTIFDRYRVTATVEKPVAYIVPQGWWKVIDRLKQNQVKMSRLSKDTLWEVEVYRIDEYRSGVRPYEMHHPNTDVKVSSRIEKVLMRKGDWYIPMNQVANRFLIETLEPHAEDSYFAWNFFDGILGQKEGYSAYVFEDIAARYLDTNAGLRSRLRERVQSDTAFAKDGRAQLNFVYQQSPWFEPAYLRYPVYRVRK